MSEPSDKPEINEPAAASPNGPERDGAGGGGAAPEGGAPAGEVTRRRKLRKRRPWYWWLANLMILAGILVFPGYFLGTCACTALHQNRLEEELEASSPQMAVASSALTAVDFYSLTTTTSTTLASTATEEEVSAAEAAIAKAKAERDAQLAAFREAANEFEASIGTDIGAPLGRILIPAIGVDVILVEGTSKRDLKEGPGHWEETPFPGQGGNFVVSGHRTTYGAPFFKLNELKPGDEIDIVLPYAVCKYTVTQTLIVYPDQVETVAQAGREQVSLAACHPIYSAKQRIVVKGDLASFKLIEPAATGSTGAAAATTTTGAPAAD